MASHGIPHKDLTDPQLHEMKGASTASANQVPFADGEGSATWQDLTIDKVILTAEEQAAVDEDVTTPPTPLDVLGLPGTPSNTCTTAVDWTGGNQNTLNVASKINEILTKIQAMDTAYTTLADSYNTLLESLKTLGLITVVYPE